MADGLTSEPNGTAGAAVQYVIRLSPDAEQRPDCERICRDLLRLGGVAIGDNYVFRCAADRAVAAEVLGDKYGERYFQLVDQPV